MNEKTVRNLGIALVVILVLYGVMCWQQNRSFEPAKPAQINFASITVKNTKNISIKGGGENYVLMKKNNKWTLKGREADQAAIDELFNGLKSAEVQQLITKKKEKLASLQIDSSNGKTVTFETKNKKYTFVFGKGSPDGTGFYIRLPKEDKTYFASGTLGFTFAKKSSDWLKKKTQTKPKT